MAGTLHYPTISRPGTPPRVTDAAFSLNTEEVGSWEHAEPSVSEETPVPAPAPDRQTERLMAEFAKTRDPRLRDRLVLMHDRMVRYLASRFDSRLSPQEDVIQVAYIGLISAIDRFDPQKGVSFVTYAIPTIVGEI